MIATISIRRWKRWAFKLKIEILTLYNACENPGTPWYAKALGALVVAYAFSPIDLIPDFIPVFGFLDDLVLIPVGVAIAGGIVIAVWTFAATFIAYSLCRRFLGWIR
jgi:uncharacterized membrane protein YkvA (DUF1232 family)